MGKIAIIGAGDEQEMAARMIEALKDAHPGYEVIYIDSCSDLSALNRGDSFDLVLCDEATRDGINERNGVGKECIAALNRLHEADQIRYPDQFVNVGTIGHVDHGSRLSRNSVHGRLSPARTLKALDHNPQGWLETSTKRGKGQRKANKASRWNGRPW
jgi:hypothetical protein